jgi:PAS domain S-box-containing protein
MPVNDAFTHGWTDRRLILSAALIAAGVFIVDLNLPLDIAISALYGTVILLGLFIREPRFPLVASIIVTVLTIVGGWLSPPGGIVSFGIANRALTLLGIWVSAWLVASYAKVGRTLNRTVKDLADTTFAIDQAAIVATTDVKGRITYVNDKFCEISKYPREELLGQDHRLINSGYHAATFIRELWQTIANGRIWRGEIRNRAKDGTFYWVDTTIVPFLDDRGKPYQYMAIRSDISERKRSEALLREQAALARLGEMAAVVAHEVKNPLAGIRGALEVIGGRMPEASRDRAVLRDIVGRIDSLNDTVHDLLVFARPREPRLTAVPLVHLLEATAALLKKDPAHATTHVDITGDRPILEVDAEQLQRVFLNLLLNAAQAAGAGGRVRAEVSSDNGLCRVTIADNGPGIPAEIRERIFEPFFTTKHRGTGLGLPTAKRVIERHQGTMTIECPAEGGTIVTVTLPAESRQREASVV